jgi:hypothetical protein
VPRAVFVGSDPALFVRLVTEQPTTVDLVETRQTGSSRR